MQLSTAYRAALLHLSVNPLLTRASVHSTFSLTASTTPQQPTSISRLHTILFPQCLAKTNTRHAHTMSSSNSNSNPDTNAPKQEPESSQAQAQAQEQKQEQLYLPEKSSTSAEEGQPQKLDLSADGGVSLDHLGPMVVNVDGTLSRIGNWEQMTEMEQKTTLRVLGKRNKQRLEALKAQGVQ